jgi:uroporphyrinogen-III decarboxylase
VSSTDSFDRRRDPVTNVVKGDEVGVDRLLLNDLATHYAEYRRVLAGPFDPVMTLTLTGDVLRSVRTILSAIGQAPGQYPINPGKAVQ